MKQEDKKMLFHRVKPSTSSENPVEECILCQDIIS